MERLTYVAENGEVLFHPADLPDDEGITITQLAKDGRYKALEEIAERLANREQAEEQGLLLRLPCKVGDTVYAPTRNFVSELRIILISIERDNVFFYWRLNTGIYPNLNRFTASDIGKMVFFTCEEAEAKLKEISCFQNGNS